MPQPEIILEVSELSNSYGGQPLLQQIHFHLKRGEILCLLGRSGSGKTTLLRLIAGLEEMESGTISFCGRDIRLTPAHKRGIGMMFQDYALFPHKNVAENIAFGLEMKKLSAGQTTARVAKMLELVGLSDFAGRRIDELSGGEQQRVALARSLAPEPKLLLLDEPLGSLDRTLRDHLTLEIRSILKTLGVTAIFVTHDQMEAFTVADKIGILQQGKLAQFAPPEQIYRHPANTGVARFLGFSNLLTGRLDTTAGLFYCELGEFALKPEQTGSHLPIREATMLLRPEGARITPAEALNNEGLTISGQVSTKSYLGSGYRVSLLIKGVELSFDLALDPPPPEVGERITLSLSPSSLVIVDSALVD